MKNVTIVGNNPEFKSGNLIKITDVSNLEFNNVVFKGSSYNTVMTGQTCTAGKYLQNLQINNCKFGEICKHVNLWLAAWKDGAIFNIKNTSFLTGEQIFCFSDFHAANDVAGFENKLTVNLENVTIDHYQKDGSEYEGIMLFDSRYCAAGTFESTNPFGADKVTLNLTNVVVNGNRLTASDFIMGNGGAGQMLYIFKAKEKVNLAYSEETKHLFPKVYVDGVLVG